MHKTNYRALRIKSAELMYVSAKYLFSLVSLFSASVLTSVKKIDPRWHTRMFLKGNKVHYPFLLSFQIWPSNASRYKVVCINYKVSEPTLYI